MGKEKRDQGTDYLPVLVFERGERDGKREREREREWREEKKGIERGLQPQEVGADRWREKHGEKRKPQRMNVEKRQKMGEKTERGRDRKSEKEDT